VIYQDFNSSLIEAFNPDEHRESFSLSELNYIESLKNPDGSASARLLAKTMILKFLQQRNCNISAEQIEILPDNFDIGTSNLSGPPCVTLPENCEQIRSLRFHLSLSHSESRACAYLVIEEE
jgi:phosphopantetheinyl transferase (holo-ACP synthase)